MKKLLIIPALAVIALAGCGAARTSTVPTGHEDKPTQNAGAGSTSKLVWTEGSAKMYEVLIPNGKGSSMRCYVTTFNGRGVSQTCNEVTVR